MASSIRNANDSLTDEIPTFDGIPDKSLEWILKLQNIEVVTKWDQKKNWP